MFSFSKQSINKKDISSVIKVLNSDYLTQGGQVPKFEKKIIKLVNAKYGVAVNSGSSALHLACLALDLKKNDNVWTVPNTYAATVNCAINCGAIIDFVDIDPRTWNISVEKLELKLRSVPKKKLPKIVIPVHFAGQPTEQKKIWYLSKKYGFKIIEDASHSFGARHFNEPVGSCKWSDITVFSFHPVKIITTAEGGIATTNSKKLAETMQIYRNNGITKNSNLFVFKKKNQPWYYEQQTYGFNFRMNDISAALGLSQLERFKKFIRKRNVIANLYKRQLNNYPIKFQKILSYNLSSYHLFVIQFDLKKSKYSYKEIFKKLRSKSIYVNLHYMPIHCSPYFKKKGFKLNQFPVSENYSLRSMSIPIYFDLKMKKLIQISNLIKNFFKN